VERVLPMVPDNMQAGTSMGLKGVDMKGKNKQIHGVGRLSESGTVQVNGNRVSVQLTKYLADIPNAPMCH
jgi:hypothetical protein